MCTISLCMIVRDEEDVLGRCLESVADLVDEIIIVDTGSKDHTKEIAAKYTDKIFDFPWIDDFAAARNQSFSRANCDYCMWLDADDVLTEPDRQKFAQLKAGLPPDVDVVMMRYNTGFDERGHVTFSYDRERALISDQAPPRAAENRKYPHSWTLPTDGGLRGRIGSHGNVKKCKSLKSFCEDVGLGSLPLSSSGPTS